MVEWVISNLLAIFTSFALQVHYFTSSCQSIFCYDIWMVSFVFVLPVLGTTALTPTYNTVFKGSFLPFQFYQTRPKKNPTFCKWSASSVTKHTVEGPLIFRSLQQTLQRPQQMCSMFAKEITHTSVYFGLKQLHNNYSITPFVFP